MLLINAIFDMLRVYLGTLLCLCFVRLLELFLNSTKKLYQKYLKPTYPKNKALPCAEKAQFVASFLTLFPVGGKECSTYLKKKKSRGFKKGLDKKGVFVIYQLHALFFFLFCFW